MLRRNAGFVPAQMSRAGHLTFVPSRISCWQQFPVSVRIGTNVARSRFFRMRIREENCNLVLLAGVTLVSAVIAGGAALLEPAAAVSRPVYLANAAATPAQANKPTRRVDPVPVRVVGAPFIPNTNPRER
jgi:hypothetical protein